MALNILVVGAGICGPAFAILLRRSNPGHQITILERFPSLRSTGQQIDLKKQAPSILRKMGLMDEMKSHCVSETGVEVVNAKGEQIALFGVSPAGERQQGLTSEHEIMRGDMVQVLYDASLRQDSKIRDDQRGGNGLKYIFNQTITDLNQDSDGVKVTFTNGQAQRYDLVVAADGQWSRTRRLGFGREASDAAFHSLGVHAAYYTIPKSESEGTLAKIHWALGKTWVLTRTSGRPVTGVLLFTMAPSQKLRASYGGSLDDQKAAFAEKLKDIDWQTDRLLDGLSTSEDFYANELGQIKMDHLSTGRVVLLGDAGYGPSPFTGLGANLSLMGAYVLAGELARNTGDIEKALVWYEKKMQPVITECQRFPTWALGLMFPSSRLAVWMTEQIAWAISKMSRLRSGQQIDHQSDDLPDYPELDLER